MDQTQVDSVSVADAWQRLSEEPKAQLIDVRTRAEWAYVGQLDLSSIGKTPVLIEWQFFPDMSLNPQFVQDLSFELKSLGVEKGSDLFFICRSGVRSLAAAQAMAASGFAACHNVAGGFEGPLDDNGHRGSVAGWKAAGLPWAQG